MAEENENKDSDVLKSIKDKLTELEDLQLVNKLDIINVKNELDKASLTGEAAPERAEELEQKSENLRKAEKLVAELEELKSTLGKGPPPDSSKFKEDLESITKQMEDLRKKVGTLEKLKAPSPPEKTEDERFDELKKRIDELQEAKPHEMDMEIPSDIREEITNIKEKLSDLEEIPKKEPKNILEKIDKIEKLSSEMESLKRQLRERKPPIAARKPPEVPEDLLDRIKMLEAAVASEMKPAKKAEEKPQEDVLEKIDKLEQKISGLAASEKAATKVRSKETKEDSGKVDELKNMLESIKSTVLDQGKEIVDLKGAEEGAKDRLQVDELRKEIDSIKSHIDEIDEKAVKIGMAPDALEELRQFKGQFPVEDFHELKKKMAVIDKKLADLSALAEGLKPIELPDDRTEESKKQLELRLKDLERIADNAADIGMFKDLEKRMQETREWLPKYVTDSINVKIEEFRKELKNKIGEVNEIKEDIVGSTIEQLLAQPGHVSKLLGERIKKELEYINKKVSQMDSSIKPSDAKLTTLLRDVEEAQRDLKNEKETFKKAQEVRRKETEDLATEVKALNTRLSSMEKPGRDIKTEGVVGLMRDLEILKTKTDWLESTINKLDLNHVYQKIEELEERMEQKSYSPYVIE